MEKNLVKQTCENVFSHHGLGSLGLSDFAEAQVFAALLDVAIKVGGACRTDYQYRDALYACSEQLHGRATDVNKESGG
jgi:hypothetical protein